MSPLQAGERDWLHGLWPSVEQPNSAMSHILHHYHSRRLANTQTEDQECSWGSFRCWGSVRSNWKGIILVLGAQRRWETATECHDWLCMCRTLSSVPLVGRGYCTVSKQQRQKLDQRQVQAEKGSTKRKTKKTKWGEKLAGEQLEGKTIAVS